METNKNEAFAFLKSLQAALTSTLPPRDTIISDMASLSEDGASSHRIRENRFIYHFVINQLYDHLQTVDGIGPGEAKQSLLCEYHAKVGAISSGNSLRPIGSPLGKDRTKQALEVFEKWTKPLTAWPINQAYPDIALRRPFPYPTVFDAKYFESESSKKAQSDLVTGVQELMHYRGLPAVQPKAPGGVGWDYEYGCLLAFDASKAGVMADAWHSVVAKSAFWDGANIFVMIIRT